MKSHGLAYRGFPLVVTHHNRVVNSSKKHTEVEAALPFVEDYLPALMARAQSIIERNFHEIVRARGFTVSEWRVLASLAGSGPVPIGRLAQFVVMKQPTVTRVLDRQEARGEVRRIAHETDRRITLVFITQKGTRQVAELIEQAREHDQRLLEALGYEKAATLKASLRQIISLHEPISSLPLSDTDD